MSNLTFTPKWNDKINQVEKGEFITGGSDGNANLATRQLAENIFFLRDQINKSSLLANDENGYYQMPNNLILQWGVATEGAINQFAIPFAQQCFSLTATLKAERNIDAVAYAQVLSLNDFKIVNGRSQNDKYYYFAVGI